MENNFLKFYKTLPEAIVTENPTVTKLPYTGFVQQKTNETFCQITNSDFDIVFVGGYTAELINGCGDVIRDITDYFYFDSFTDNNGIKQIAFEFGMLSTNYYSQILYIKLTDTVNGNIWYSAPITINNKENSIRIDYWSTKSVNGTAYDIMPFKQSIRLSDCYKNDVSDENSAKQYTVTTGNIVAYRRTTTLYNEYIFESLDEFTYRRLNAIFNNDYVYLDGHRVVLKEIKKETREGDTNKFKVTITVNPYEDIFNWGFQLFEGIDVITYFVPKNAIFTQGSDPSSGGQMYVEFNRTINVETETYAQLWKDGVMIEEALIGGDNSTIADFWFINSFIGSGLPENGHYSIVIPANKITSGSEVFGGVVYDEWRFTIGDGDWLNTDWNNDDWFTN